VRELRGFIILTMFFTYLPFAAPPMRGFCFYALKNQNNPP
jgi:hypothetical protein